MIGRYTTLAIFLGSTSMPLMAQELPSAMQLKDRLSLEMPSYWSINDLRIVNSLVQGDPINPMAIVRFEANTTPLFDLYHSTGETVGPFEVITNSLESETTRTLYGTIQMSYSAGNWVGEPNIENPVYQLGVPRDMYEVPTVELGSQEQSDLMARLYDSQIREKEAILETALLELQAKHEQTKIQLENSLQSELASIRSKVDPEISRHKRELQNSLDELTRDNNKEINTIMADHSKIVGELKAKQAQIVAELEVGLLETKRRLEREYSDAAEVLELQEQLIPILKLSSEKQREVENIIRENKNSSREFFESFGSMLHGSIDCKITGSDRTFSKPIFFEVSDTTAAGIIGKVKFDPEDKRSASASLNLATANGVDTQMLTFAIQGFGTHELRFEDNGVMRGVGGGNIKSSMNSAGDSPGTCVTVLGGK